MKTQAGYLLFPSPKKKQKDDSQHGYFGPRKSRARASPAGIRRKTKNEALARPGILLFFLMSLRTEKKPKCFAESFSVLRRGIG